MPKRPCLRCGELTQGSWCPRHRPHTSSPSERAWSRPGAQKLREQVLRRDGYACVVCGSMARLQIHHRVPLADGGAHLVENMEVRCRECHLAAHARA